MFATRSSSSAASSSLCRRLLASAASIFSIATLLCLCASLTSANAAALTTLVKPGERACYYAWVDEAGEKVGWYFAVQSGGDFEIEWSITSPSNKVVVEGSHERQADIIFTGQEVGEYTFCLQDPNFAAEKMVDFDITVESEPRLSLPLGQTALLSEHSAPLEESIGKVQDQLTSVVRTQRYFRTWENRGFDTVKSTQSKLFWFSITETLLIVGISFGQVSLIRYLFDNRGTKRYRV
ncbi:unnamed protein product [Parajaminaea phylloscopi]